MISFDLNQVRLTDSVLAHRQKLVRKYILDFDINRLMHNFRINAGKKSDAEPLGGWESPKCELRGHFVGHFLSACAKYAYGFNDLQMSRKAADIVNIMEECTFENGYLSAFEEEQLDKLEKNENSGIWAPYYTLHKILNGLVSCGIYTKNKKALTLAENLALYIYERFQKLSYWKIDNILRCTKVNPVNEFGGIGDTLYSIWEISGNEKILELAKLFDRDYFVGNLSKGKDILEDLHANTHLPMIVAAMHRYGITGEEKYKTAGLNFYKYILPRTFVNGNNSSRAEHYIKGGVSEFSEHWGERKLSSKCITGGESESCCAHNTENFLSYLLQYDTENSITYLNHLETLKYNAVANCASSKTGLSQYHQPLGVKKKKKFSSLYDDFWCCMASGIEAMSELQKNIWFKDGENIVINMFVSSSLLLEKKVRIDLISDYPKSEKATLVIHTEKPVTLCFAFKESSISKVVRNEEECKLERTEGFTFLKGTFQDKDEVKIDICSELKKVSLGEEKEIFAVMYGNILLAETEGGFTESENLKKNEKGEFVGDNCKFIPLYQIEEEMYTVYLNSNITGEAKDGSSAYSFNNESTFI